MLNSHLKKLSRFILFFLTISIAFNQWFYAQSFYKTQFILKVLTSLFFWNLVVIILWFVCRIFVLDRLNYESRKIGFFRSIKLLIFFTFPSIILVFLHEGFGYNTIEGLKFVSGFLLIIAITEVLSKDIAYLFRLILLVYVIQVIFGISQLLIGVSYSTSENFMTVGVLNRWWGLDSIWGTFSLSGKNSYGICLVLFTSIVFYFAKTTDQVFLKIAIFCTLPFALLCIYFSHSRTAILCVGYFAVTHTWQLLKKSNFLLFTLLIVSWSSAVLVIINTEQVSAWVLDSRSLFARSLQQRDALNAMSSNILIGGGFNSVLTNPGNFTGGGTLINSSNSILGLSTDNFFLRRFLETGFLGAISLIYLLVQLHQFTKSKIGSLSGYHIEKRLLVWQVLITLIFACSSFDFLSNQTNVCYVAFVLCYIVNMKDEPSDYGHDEFLGSR